MLIPKEQKGNKGTRKWFKAERLKKIASKQSQKKEEAKKYVKDNMKEVVLSYACQGCKKSFGASSLRKQFIEAVRNGQSFVSCPVCSSVLIKDRIIKVATNISKINRNADLYLNQNIVPGYVPSQWVDRAILERVAHILGKFAVSVGMFNPQLKFQRGMREAIYEGGPQNVKYAEYTIESVDNNDVRFRVVAVAGITPSGEVMLPKIFKTLQGSEIPFTKEGVQSFTSGKVFGAPEPNFIVPEMHFREKDFTRFREIVAKKKTAEELYYEGETIQVDSLGTERHGELAVITYISPESGNFVVQFEDGEKEEYSQIQVKKIASTKKKTAAGVPVPGQQVEYQGKIYTIDSTTGIDAILTDETGMKTAPIPSADLNIQATPGGGVTQETLPGGPMVAPTAPMASVDEKIDKLVKKSLRDEKTLVPFTDPDPDYSVAKQTDVDPDFGVPYEESNQGILPEEDRAVQKMFRGGSSIIPTTTKSAAEEESEEEEEEYRLGLCLDCGETMTHEEWVENEFKCPYCGSERIEEMEKAASLTKTAPEKEELESMVQTCMREKGWSHDKCMNYVAGGIWHRKGDRHKTASLQKRAVKCEECMLEMTDPKTETCTKEYINLKGKGYLRDTSYFDVNERCHDCNIVNKLGNIHHFGCDIERCPICGGQLIGCGHADKDTFVFSKKASSNKKVKKASPAEGIAPFIYEIVTEGVKEGKSFNEIKKIIEEKHPGFEFKEEDYEEAKFGKEASIKKKAEPTGYHETDETGKQIPIERLRMLVEDYVRAGQIPLDFDLTKITSEVSRMTRKELEEIIDKKLKDQHYPVVHAKKENLEKIVQKKDFDSTKGKSSNEIVQEIRKKAEKSFTVGDEVKTIAGLKGSVVDIIPNYKSPRTGIVYTAYEVLLEDGRKMLYSLVDLEKAAYAFLKEKTADLFEKTPEERFEIFADYVLTDEDFAIDVVKAVTRSRSVPQNVKNKVASDLEEFTDERNYDALERAAQTVLDYFKNHLSLMEKWYRKDIDDLITNLEETEEKEASIKKTADLSEKMVEEHIEEEQEGAEMYNDMAKEVECPKAEKALKDMAEDETEHAEKLEEVVLPAVEYEPEEETEKEASKLSVMKKESVSEETIQEILDKINRGLDVLSGWDSGKVKLLDPAKNAKRISKWIEEVESVFGTLSPQTQVHFRPTLDKYKEELDILGGEYLLEKEASLRFALEEVDVKEKPKTEFKELKTKPHGEPSSEEVKEAPVATPEMQKTFHEVQNHKQRLGEIKSLVDEARAKVEEQIRKIQEEHGSVTEAAELQEGIEKLSSLVEQAQTQVIDLGEFFLYLDTSVKEKKFKPSDKWRVEKLLEKFGEDAKIYLEKAERGASSLNEEVQQRVLTMFPKREGSTKEANVFDAIRELGSGLWAYIKSLSEIVEEGNQLELAL